MKKRLILLALLILLSVTAVPVFAADGVGAENYLYSVSGDSVTLTKYFGENDTEIVIPVEIDGIPVTKIGEKCFEDHEEIQRVILPDTLKVIDYRAFYGCSGLTEMNLPESLEKTGGWVFAHSGFSSVTFPEGFTSLGYGAFYGSDNLKTVILPEGVTSIGENTFRMCPKLESVTIPSSEIEINIKGFQEKSKVTIIGVPGSYAEKYAKAIGIGFEAYQESEAPTAGTEIPNTEPEVPNTEPEIPNTEPAIPNTAPRIITCTNCGEEYPSDAGYAFCPNCGSPLEDESETPANGNYAEDLDETAQNWSEYVLSQLGNSVYRETYDALSEGKPVSTGAYGTAAKGLQQTLIDFGQKLSADGQAGGKTFEALHTVQDAFGLDRTDTVDADGYSQLLLRLLVFKEMEEDEYSVTDKISSLPGEPVDYDECTYMMACADYLRGRYYKAKDRFEYCYWGDAEERAEKCIQPWQSTGQIWKDSSMGAGTQLTITVNGEPDVGMHVKIYQQDGRNPDTGRGNGRSDLRGTDPFGCPAQR